MIVGGIVALTVVFTRLATSLSAARGGRLKGVVELDEQDHIVLLGYTPGRTERLVSTLVHEGRRLVVCAWDEVAEHPMTAQRGVAFVRGDLAHTDVMRRAGVAAAATVVIDGRDDNEALMIAVAVDHANPHVHLVAALRDLARCEHLLYVNPRVQCVQWHQPRLIAEEALDPGITQVYAGLKRRAWPETARVT